MDNSSFPTLRRLPLLGPLWADSLVDVLEVSQAAVDAVFQVTLRPAGDQPDGPARSNARPALAAVPAATPQQPRAAA